MAEPDPGAPQPCPCAPPRTGGSPEGAVQRLGFPLRGDGTKRAAGAGAGGSWAAGSNVRLPSGLPAENAPLCSEVLRFHGPSPEPASGFGSW